MENVFNLTVDNGKAMHKLDFMALCVPFPVRAFVDRDGWTLHCKVSNFAVQSPAAVTPIEKGERATYIPLFIHSYSFIFIHIHSFVFKNNITCTSY